jgi:hypothetical protein
MVQIADEEAVSPKTIGVDERPLEASWRHSTMRLLIVR